MPRCGRVSWLVGWLLRANSLPVYPKCLGGLSALATVGVMIARRVISVVAVVALAGFLSLLDPDEQLSPSHSGAAVAAGR